MIYGLSIGNTQKVKYDYDPLCRLTSSYLGTNLAYKTTYRYVDNPDKSTTTLLAGIKNGSASEISYVYDQTGNITQIKEGTTLKKSYEYDSLGQLTRENDADANKTYTYTYDSGGNILTKSTHAYTTGALGAITECTVYGYDTTFKDLLIGTKTYSGNPSTAPLVSQKAIVSDTIGNPTTYGAMTMTWQNGRRLASISASGLLASYTYNDGGIRTSKTVGGVTTTYVLSGTSILKQTKGADSLEFFYSTSGEVFGFTYNGTEYWYVRNGQRDIIGIINNAGTVVVSYTYDAWGNPIATTGTLASTVGAANPFRYRGYYYDVETGFYYLNSRYFDPAVGRFLNADKYADTGQGVIGSNMFAYCLNNPVQFFDPSGLDAIACNNSGVVGSGHMSAFVQDADGNWYFFIWGDEVIVKQVDDASIMSDSNEINKWLRDVGLNKRPFGYYKEFVYMSGDFTASLEYYRELADAYQNRDKNGWPLKNPDYDLFTWNCTHVTMNGLYLGILNPGKAREISVGDFMTKAGYEITSLPGTNIKNLQKAFGNKSYTKT